MKRTFIDSGNAGVGDVLAFIDTAVKEGASAAVPAPCIPLLAGPAGCQPQRNGAEAGCYLFHAPAGARTRCGFLERVTAVCFLVALAPLLVALSVLIYLFDGAPVLFLQERYGREGVPFTIFKFRTMMRLSERLQAKLQRRQGTEDRLFKLERDPRVTRIGGFLRRTFMDELPQLVNVARGEMRLIGPRPLPASDQGHYTQPCHALRLKGTPGMTGLWQVSGRNERTFEEMCLLDCYYLCNRSAALDLSIAGRTARLVLKQVSLKRESESDRQQPVDV